jgi:hypothetical protein
LGGDILLDVLKYKTNSETLFCLFQLTNISWVKSENVRYVNVGFFTVNLGRLCFFSSIKVFQTQKRFIKIFVNCNK